MTVKRRIMFWGAGWLAGLVLAGTALWIHGWGGDSPAAAYQDVRACLQARNSDRPVERFLELRYGALTEPRNRQQILLDFFNVDHIESLYLILARAPAAERAACTAAMAEWFAGYRQTMSAEEKRALHAYCSSAPGQATIRLATTRYLKKSSRFRAETAAVVQELMTTLDAIQQPCDSPPKT